MEIRIKTAEEFHAGNVTIEIRASSSDGYMAEASGVVNKISEPDRAEWMDARQKTSVRTALILAEERAGKAERQWAAAKAHAGDLVQKISSAEERIKSQSHVMMQLIDLLRGIQQLVQGAEAENLPRETIDGVRELLDDCELLKD